jgi:hypothetical protein
LEHFSLRLRHPGEFFNCLIEGVDTHLRGPGEPLTLRLSSGGSERFDVELELYAVLVIVRFQVERYIPRRFW